MDIYRTVTDKIIAGLENAAKWEKPWQSSFKGITAGRPRNAESKTAYRGINVPLLWSAGYESADWATYKCWARLGAQVRKGERGTLAVWWSKQEVKSSEPSDNSTNSDDDAPEYRMIARYFYLFNAAQVEGYQGEQTAPKPPSFDPIENAETFFRNTGGIVRHGGDRAFYAPGPDSIQMPLTSQFIGTSTSTAQEAYYSTLGHEFTHWTGHKNRCDRDFSGRFGSEAYAAEELVAELGASFLAADLGIALVPRADHAAYIGSWLKVLRNDKRAIFTAASKAEQAVKFLHSLQPQQQPLAIAA